MQDNMTLKECNSRELNMELFKLLKKLGHPWNLEDRAKKEVVLFLAMEAAFWVLDYPELQKTEVEPMVLSQELPALRELAETLQTPKDYYNLLDGADIAEPEFAEDDETVLNPEAPSILEDNALIEVTETIRNPAENLQALLSVLSSSPLM